MSEGKENLPWTQPNFKATSILDLSQFDLGPIGTTALAEFIRRDKFVETLDMTQTNIVGDTENGLFVFWLTEEDGSCCVHINQVYKNIQ